MKIQNVMRLAILSASICAGFSHAAIKNAYLADARPLIKFNELTQQEKVLLAGQAQLFLRDLYVHRYQKIEYYGMNGNPGYIDPALKAQEIVTKVNSASGLSTTDLHKGLSQAFVAQRDLHLNYNFPLPHAAFVTHIPISFARTASATDQNEVRISTDTRPGTSAASWFAAFYSGIRVPARGDQVLEYNGLPIKQAVQNAVVNGNGANLYAGFSRALQYMTFTSQASSLPPANDSVTLKLKAASTGEEYSITLKWLVQYDDTQIGTPAPTLRSASQFAATSVSSSVGIANKRILNLASANQDLSMSNEPTQERYNQFLAKNGLDSYAAITKLNTAEPTIKYAVVDRGSKKVGYLSISSFSPNSPQAYIPSLYIIEGLLRNQLAATDALVIDVRNNGGGYISYADILPAMFIPGRASANSARLLNTSLNYNFLSILRSTPGWGDWWNVISNAQKTKDRYSKTAGFTSDGDVNWFGQLYYKPVGVLANARSFSATDLFTCAMRDNGAATIYGEDPKTGAGGANVITHAYFNSKAPGLFPALPGGVSMRVSWRQSIRSGLAAGTMIEDQGCNADVQVPRTLSDLSNGDQTQFDTIADHLLAKPVSKSTINNFKQFVSGNYVPVVGDMTTTSSPVQLSYQVANTDLIKTYINDVLVSTNTVRIYGQPSVLTSNVPVACGDTKVSIVGTNSAHVPLWNTSRWVTRTCGD